jgi:hypothetical protein
MDGAASVVLYEHPGGNCPICLESVFVNNVGAFVYSCCFALAHRSCIQSILNKECPCCRERLLGGHRCGKHMLPRRPPVQIKRPRIDLMKPIAPSWLVPQCGCTWMARPDSNRALDWEPFRTVEATRMSGTRSVWRWRWICSACSFSVSNCNYWFQRGFKDGFRIPTCQRCFMLRCLVVDFGNHQVQPIRYWACPSLCGSTAHMTPKISPACPTEPIWDGIAGEESWEQLHLWDPVNAPSSSSASSSSPATRSVVTATSSGTSSSDAFAAIFASLL